MATAQWKRAFPVIVLQSSIKTFNINNYINPPQSTYIKQGILYQTNKIWYGSTERILLEVEVTYDWISKGLGYCASQIVVIQRQQILVGIMLIQDKYIKKALTSCSRLRKQSGMDPERKL